MDIRKVKKLIELLEESGIAEIEIKEGEEAVRISRYPTGMQATMSAPAPQQLPLAAAPASAAAAPARPAAAADEEPAGHKVLSPMVGTYYEASAPGAAPFVKLGSEVQVGETLCVIEAMKMMNQIEAEVAGKVTAILARNGEAVEFGQPLFIIA